MKKKKIIICTRDLDFGVGSVVKTELKKFDSDKNIEKIIVIGPKKLKGYSKKVNFELIKNKGTFFITKEPYFAFKCNRKIKEILKKEKVDEIRSHFPIYAENFGVPLIIKFHLLHKSILKNYPKTPKFLIAAIFHRLYTYFDCKTMRYANKIFFVSKRTMEEVKLFYPEFKNKFFYSPNEIDKTKFFKLNKRQKQRLKKQFGFNDKKKNLLYVGRLEPLKGILDLIKIIGEINNLNIRLIVIGDGPLKKKIQKHAFVKYLGKIPNEELYKYYNIADLFILSSFYENYPITLLEAKACGCKILARNVGDNKHILKKNLIFEKDFELKLKIISMLK